MELDIETIEKLAQMKVTAVCLKKPEFEKFILATQEHLQYYLGESLSDVGMEGIPGVICRGVQVNLDRRVSVVLKEME